MTTYSPSNISYAVVVETEAGVTPANPAYKKVAHIPGTAPVYTSDFGEAGVITSGRASAGGSKTNYRVEGGLKTNLHRDAGLDILLQSAFAGQWVETGDVGEGDDVLKASDKDTSFTLQKTVNHPTAPLISRHTGVQVAKMGITCEAGGYAEVSWDFMGMGRELTPMAGSTYLEPATTPMLTGKRVTVTIGGLTNVKYSSFDLSIEHTKEALACFGSDSAAAIGTSGNRKSNANIKFYRKDLTPETVFAGDNSVPVTITIGGEGDGYMFVYPAATCAVPTDEEAGAAYIVSLDLTAKKDGAAGTDAYVVRL